jgi:hypothetical protein
MQRLALGMIAALCLTSLAVKARAQSAFGHVETPTSGSTVYGVALVEGWVLDINQVDNIKIYLDGQYQNTADLNIPRPDVLAAFPAYAGSPTANPGFISSFYASDANLADGPHTLTVVVTESAHPDAPVTIGTVPVVVDKSINQPPFGSIDVPGRDPNKIESFSSVFPVVGWALDDSGIDHLDFLIDGQAVAGAVCCNELGTATPSSASTAIYGSTRPDVLAAFPQVPNALFSGFGANIDSTAFLDGIHTLSVRATDIDGSSRVVSTRTFQISNASLNLHPFGQIDVPLDQFTFVPVCSASGGLPSGCDFCTRSDLNIVSGWVLDTGAREDFGQTGYVQLLIDGVIIADTRRDCVVTSTGAFENCYGVNRPDVEQNYPGFVNSNNAGYVFDFFAIDDQLGHLSIQIPVAGGGSIEVTRIASGKHTLAVRAGDDAETVSLIAQQSANFVTCRPSGANLPPIGYIDTPFSYQFVTGVIPVTGWAFDSDGVDHVEIDVDGQVIGNAVYGGSRPDVPAADSRVSGSNVGFGFLLDTTTLSDSPHDINVYVVDHRDERQLLGTRKMVVNNNVETHGQ